MTFREICRLNLNFGTEHFIRGAIGLTFNRISMRKKIAELNERDIYIGVSSF